MADISVPVQVTPTPPIPPKPGYKTTEWWGHLAAMALTLVFASGILTNATEIQIAGIAAAWLGSFGYQVNRSWVKTSAVLLLVGALGTAPTACTATERSAAATNAGHAAINCTATVIGTTPGLDLATLAAIANTVAAERTKCMTASGLDWTCVETDAIGQGVTLGGCALVQLVAAAAKAISPAVSGLAANPAPPPGRAELEAFRRKVGGATWHTATGDL
jgi:hypothetical protein